MRVYIDITYEVIFNFLAGSINLICVPLGCMISGALTQPFGRKPSMIALTFPFIMAWLLFHYAATVAELYVALAICGLCGGLLEAPVSSLCVISIVHPGNAYGKYLSQKILVARGFQQCTFYNISRTRHSIAGVDVRRRNHSTPSPRSARRLIFRDGHTGVHIAIYPGELFTLEDSRTSQHRRTRRRVNIAVTHSGKSSLAHK